MILINFCLISYGEKSTINDHKELILSHDQYDLDNLTFISDKYFVAQLKLKNLANEAFVLFDKHHLPVDTLWLQIDAPKLFPLTDSTFLLQSKNESIIILIKKNYLRIANKFIPLNFDSNYLRKASFSAPGSSFQLCMKSSKESKKRFDLVLQSFNENMDERDELVLTELNVKSKSPNTVFSISDNELSLYLNEEQLFISCKPLTRSLKKMTLPQGKWLYFFDHVDDSHYFLEVGKTSHRLFSEIDGELVFEQEIMMVPEAIFDSNLHIKLKEDKRLAHYLMPMKTKSINKSELLQEVLIQPK